ncbi:clathrin heavy chain [Peniophora sp. CONT]|nr:clathrin heavy chain [Peniophora sp. CONT]
MSSAIDLGSESCSRDIDECQHPNKLFAFSVRTYTGAKLHVVEIDHQALDPPFTNKAVDIYFPPEATNDFPVAMQVSKKHEIVYFATKPSPSLPITNGILCAIRKGQVLSVSVDVSTWVPYILTTLSNFGEAAKIEANFTSWDSPYRRGHRKFQASACTARRHDPDLAEHRYLFRLSYLESVELARPVLQQGRKQLLETWLKENKLTCSEELGDIVRLYDFRLALSVYLRANVPNKVIACFAETGQTDKILLYANKVGFHPDYVSLLQHIMRTNQDQGAEFAAQLVNIDSGALIDVERVVDIFRAQYMIQLATSFFHDALKENKAEQGHLQTRLLEMNLLHAPQVADAILGNEMSTHYDRPRTANLCEKAGLLQRVPLERYEDIADIKRAILQTNILPVDWLVNNIAHLTREQTMACLNEIMRVNMRQNLQVVVQIATGLGLSRSSRCSRASRLSRACTTTSIREVERIVRESNHNILEKVKNFLKEAGLQDQVPFIIVCDRFDFVHDLVPYLYQNGLTKFIEDYVQRVTSVRTPQVVGLLASVTGEFPIDGLVQEVEQRNRLKLSLPWLDARVQQGSQDPLYEPLIIGKFCEALEPTLVYIAYAKGFCDDELIAMTKENSAQVVNPETIHRRQLIDQVVSTAMPESTDPDDVTVTVKAFIDARLPIELIEILEKMILEPSPFSDNGSLQNLLMLTAIRAGKGKVIAISNGLYEEAFTIYTKHEQHVNAINALVEYIVSLDRGVELAKAQLGGLRMKDAIDSSVKAGDPSNFAEVIEIANHAGKHKDLVRYLQMARKTLREPKIDTELAYACAKTDRLHDFLNFTNIADILVAGGKLATTLIYLGENQAAVESARKAGNTRVWKQVHAACLEKGEFYMSERDTFRILALLEAGLSLERAHICIFTDLATLCSKYKPEKFVEHLKLFVSRINIPKVIKAAEKAHLWPELVFLYIKYDEFDNTALAVMERSADAWEHNHFKDVMVRVANIEMRCRYTSRSSRCSLPTCAASHPSSRPFARRARVQQAAIRLHPARPHLDTEVVHEAYKSMLIEEEDYKTLRDSVNSFDNFKNNEPARELEQHGLSEFSRLAAHSCRQDGRWDEFVALSKQDKLHKDAMVTAAASNESAVIEDLSNFVDTDNEECFAATLYVCFNLQPSDIIQQTGSLREKLMTLEKKVKEQSKKKVQEVQAESEAAMINPGCMRLAITQGSGFATPPPMNGGFATEIGGFWVSDHPTTTFLNVLRRSTLGMSGTTLDDHGIVLLRRSTTSFLPRSQWSTFEA